MIKRDVLKLKFNKNHKQTSAMNDSFLKILEKQPN